ncbi:MAG: hypothetical protein WC679_14165, partial [Bacteroidales bacterium]
MASKSHSVPVGDPFFSKTVKDIEDAMSGVKAGNGLGNSSSSTKTIKSGKKFLEDISKSSGTQSGSITGDIANAAASVTPGKKTTATKVIDVIDKLNTLLYGTVGAIEVATGKSEGKGLVENIKANIKEKGTFGDYLRNSGMKPSVLTSVLGFTGDVLLDPLTYIPIAGWAAKGGKALKGVGLAEKLLKGGRVAKAAGSAIEKLAVKADIAGLKVIEKKVIKSGSEDILNELAEKAAKLTGGKISRVAGDLAERKSNFIQSLNKNISKKTYETYPMKGFTASLARNIAGSNKANTANKVLDVVSKWLIPRKSVLGKRIAENPKLLSDLMNANT